MVTDEDTRTNSVNNLKKGIGQAAFIIGSFLVAFCISLTLLCKQIDSQAFHEGIRTTEQPALNIWFDSNAPLVYLAMTSTNTYTQMTNRHPLFAYIGVLPVKVMGVVGIPEPMGVSLILAFGVGLMSGLFALTLVMTIENMLLVWLSQALFFASSSFIFWSGICERFPFGSATILAVTAGVAYYTKKKSMPIPAAVILNIISLSVTITNWMFGLLMTLQFFKIKKSVKVTIYTLLITVLLWSMEQIFIEQRNSLLHIESWNQKFILNSYAGPLYQKLVALLGHTIVIPNIHLYGFAEGIGAEAQEMLGVAHSMPGSGSLLANLLAITWSFIFVIGGFLWWRKDGKTTFDRFLFFAILGQITLHMFYGVELFLYGLHIVPLVLLLVARGFNETTGTMRRSLVMALCLFVPLLAFHNINQYIEARALYLERYEKRLYSSTQNTPLENIRKQTLPHSGLD